jgi:hypothetical protein
MGNGASVRLYPLHVEKNITPQMTLVEEFSFKVEDNNDDENEKAMLAMERNNRSSRKRNVKQKDVAPMNSSTEVVDFEV